MVPKLETIPEIEKLYRLFLRNRSETNGYSISALESRESMYSDSRADLL